MDEGGKDQEVKPIISNLFPLQEESVSNAFRDLDPRENPFSAQKAVDEETRMFRDANPNVFSYFADFAQEMRDGKVPEDGINQMFWGIMLCYRALREEAKSKGGVLPQFTDEFIESYDKNDMENIKAECTDKGISRGQAIAQLANMDIVKFENLELEFNMIIREEFGRQPNWQANQDFKYSGIMDVYFLFREGCSDPKNFQKAPR